MVQNCTPTRSMNALLAGGLRYFGRRMLLFLSSHHDFDKMVEKYIPTKDLATIRATVPHSEIQVLVKPTSELTKVPGEKPQDTPSARGRRYIPCGEMRYASSLNRQPQIVSSKDASKAQVHSIADKTKYIKQLKYTDRTRSRCVQAWPQVRILPTVRGGPNHMTRGR
ncbi:hypothetical protein P4O66_023076 [Electrophorus voltai]|uniref:Uncharacterized protein n=1 Tax=Electrophorus voltai TaxID=2609070 RepID=A0AAD9E151_9TELE|nr:hypothetical protein P4O66_023076 [Electrophorus voltai]